nr:phosphomannomutase/phosphoglucomutase [Treponema sp.]
MECKKLLSLQNGSDIRGVATDGVEGEKINLTPDACNLIAQSFALWLSKKTGKVFSELSVGLGRDSRISGEKLLHSVLQGLSSCGVTVSDCDLATTPAMFMSTVFPETSFDGAIMITASHLPFNRNGLKFFDKDGGLEASDIKEILQEAEKFTPENALVMGARKFALLNLYSKYLGEKIRRGIDNGESEKPLTGLKIIVDAGNGSGGFFVSQILEELGADTQGSQFLEPDGRFPNHIPNPENKEAMESIQAAVLKNKADLGLIFDTDVDRMSAVFPDGREVNRDAIIALMAAILAPEYPGSTIITDSVTSDRLTRFLEKELGLKHHCFKRGYKNVINECKRLNKEGIVSPLAMETSGHGALKDNFYLDDGAFLAVKIIIALARAKRQGKNLESLIENLEPL